MKYVLSNADEGGGRLHGSQYVGRRPAVRAWPLPFTIGAAQGYVYVRAEYPLAVARLRKAIDPTACGLLKNISAAA